MTGLGEKTVWCVASRKKNHCCVCTNLTTICAENQTLFPGNNFSRHVATTYAPWLEGKWNTVISCNSFNVLFLWNVSHWNIIQRGMCVECSLCIAIYWTKLQIEFTQEQNINPSDPLRHRLTKNMHLHFLSFSNPSVKRLVLLVLNINDNYSH